MKKILFVMSAVALFAMTFVSCSKDNDPTLAEGVSGVYKTNMYIGVGTPVSDEATPVDMDVQIVAKGDNVIELSLLSDDMPIKISDVPIVGADAVASVDYKGMIPLFVLGDTEYKNLELTLKGTLKSGTEMDLSIVVMIDLMGDGNKMPIYVELETK